MFSESRQNLLQILSVFSLIASEFRMNTKYQQSSKYDFNYVQDYRLALFGDIYPKTACMWKNSPIGIRFIVKTSAMNTANTLGI